LTIRRGYLMTAHWQPNCGRRTRSAQPVIDIEAPGPPNRIRELRGMRGLSLNQTAAAIGLAARVLKRMERGLEPVPDTVAFELAAVLATSVAWLLAEDSSSAA
jgi:ribosome-binding protein aMBF1 (putative translation factor)